MTYINLLLYFKTDMGNKRLIDRILGNYTTLVIDHIVRPAMAFIIMVFSLYLVNIITIKLFRHDDSISKLAHIMELYAASLGLIGYATHMTLETYGFIKKQFQSKE